MGVSKNKGKKPKMDVKHQVIIHDTVDGRNAAPVEVGSLSHYSTRFIYPRWLLGISEPSTVCCC